MNKRFVIHFLFILFLFSLFCFLSIIQRCSYPLLTHVVNNKWWKWIHLRRSCFLSSIWFLGPCYFYCAYFHFTPNPPTKIWKKRHMLCTKTSVVNYLRALHWNFFQFCRATSWSSCIYSSHNDGWGNKINHHHCKWLVHSIICC